MTTEPFSQSPFEIVEEKPGLFRVYCLGVGLLPCGTQAQAAQLFCELEEKRRLRNEAIKQDEHDLLRAGVHHLEQLMEENKKLLESRALLKEENARLRKRLGEP